MTLKILKIKPVLNHLTLLVTHNLKLNFKNQFSFQLCSLSPLKFFFLLHLMFYPINYFEWKLKNLGRNLTFWKTLKIKKFSKLLRIINTNFPKPAWSASNIEKSIMVSSSGVKVSICFKAHSDSHTRSQNHKSWFFFIHNI